MFRSKTSVLAMVSIVILGSILGKLAIDNRLPWQTAEASNIAVDDTGTLEDEAVETQEGSKITFQEALRIAETAVDGKAYGMERETQDGRPVIEVRINGKEVFVDSESGKVVLNRRPLSERRSRRHQRGHRGT